jgi:hypothetical protein
LLAPLLHTILGFQCQAPGAVLAELANIVFLVGKQEFAGEVGAVDSVAIESATQFVAGRTA